MQRTIKKMKIRQEGHNFINAETGETFYTSIYYVPDGNMLAYGTARQDFACWLVRTHQDINVEFVGPLRDDEGNVHNVQTSQDAFERICQARIGCFAVGHTAEYLKKLRIEIARWLQAVDEKIATTPDATTHTIDVGTRVMINAKDTIGTVCRVRRWTHLGKKKTFYTVLHDSGSEDCLRSQITKMDQIEDPENVDDPNGCAECARSNGPHYTGPCEH